MPPRQGASAVRVTCAFLRAREPVLLCLAALSLGGCGLDERTLVAASGGISSGGSSSDPRNVGGAAPISKPDDASTGGDGGQSADVPVCDYSGDVAADCTTLVQNAGFDIDTSGWHPDGGVYGIWRDADANSAKGSGSIDVLNMLAGDDGGVAPGAARQCLPAVPGKTYDLASDVFIEAGQGDGPMPGAPYLGKAVLGAFFFDDEICEGTSVGFFNAKEITESDKWQHVTASGTAPELTKSILVRLNALKPIREYMFRATFDNVLVRERGK
jgi:hypothetical protein